MLTVLKLQTGPSLTVQFRYYPAEGKFTHVEVEGVHFALKRMGLPSEDGDEPRQCWEVVEVRFPADLNSDTSPNSVRLLEEIFGKRFVETVAGGADYGWERSVFWEHPQNHDFLERMVRVCLDKGQSVKTGQLLTSSRHQEV